MPHRQDRMSRVSTEQVPHEERADSDARLRAIYVELADALPGGRKRLGMYAARVTKAAAHAYTPRPTDLEMLVRAGANPHLVALALMELVDEIVAAEVEPVHAPTAAMVVRVAGEAAAAVAEWAERPSAVTERTAIRCESDAVRVLTLHSRCVASARRKRASRRTALGVVEVVK